MSEVEENLGEVLDSQRPYPARVSALQMAAEKSPAVVLTMVRKRIRREEDPFVLATMLSVIGRLGDSGDESILLPFVMNEDSRVASNAIEAFHRLSIPLPPWMALKLLTSPEERLVANTLSSMAGRSPEFVIGWIAARIESDSLAWRMSLLHVLKHLVENPMARTLLVQVLWTEERTAVLKIVTDSLAPLVARPDSGELRSELRAIAESADGSRLSLLRALLDENPPPGSFAPPSTDAE